MTGIDHSGCPLSGLDASGIVCHADCPAPGDGIGVHHPGCAPADDSCYQTHQTN